MSLPHTSLFHFTLTDWHSYHHLDTSLFIIYGHDRKIL